MVRILLHSAVLIALVGGCGESGEQTASVTIGCGFEPKKLVVDPDVHVLMLERSKAQVALKAGGRAGA